MSYGSIPYNDQYETPDLVDCIDCNKRFMAYPDSVDLCTSCMLKHPDLKNLYRNRSKEIKIEHLFE